MITETSITYGTSIGSFIHRDNPLRYGNPYLASMERSVKGTAEAQTKMGMQIDFVMGEEL